MKIVNRKTFLEMPAYTLFSKYEPCIFGPLMIKGDSLSNDFFEQQISDGIKNDSSEDFEEKLFLAQNAGISLEMDFDYYGRDGCFDGEEVLFAIWEKEDVRKLISQLLICEQVAE